MGKTQHQVHTFSQQNQPVGSRRLDLFPRARAACLVCPSTESRHPTEGNVDLPHLGPSSLSLPACVTNPGCQVDPLGSLLFQVT